MPWGCLIFANMHIAVILETELRLSILAGKTLFFSYSFSAKEQLIEWDFQNV